MFVPTIFSEEESGGIDTGDIGHSLRFRRSASASITTSTNPATTSTYFCLFKQGALGAINPIFDGNIKINANNTITAFGLTTTAVARDPTSFHWMHISNNGLVFDGVNLGAVTTSAITGLRLGYDGTNYADMYGARMCVVSGTSLPYTDFVTFNTTINEWVVKSKSAIKALVDAGDAESSMYEFDDATSLTTLGYDESSKANNATLNNFSLTAGTTYDHMLDVPGNSFQTMSPINSSLPSGVVDGNLKVYVASGALDYVHASAFAVSSGVWWYEVESLAYAAGSAAIGVFRAGGNIATGGYSNANFYGYLNSNGNKLNAASVAYGTGWSTVGDKIGCLMDFTSGTLSITFYKKVTGTWTSQGVAYSGLTGEFYPACMCYNGNSLAFTFGQRTFDNATPPSSAKALCQANLPDVAILNPKLHFDIKTRTGTAATYSVTGIGFQPDLVWSKSRGRAVDHALYDSVRGVQKQLESNTTTAETTETTGLTAFNSDGYTGGALDQINGTTATNSFVDWFWKAGGAAVSNTAGSITSQVSANVDAGFSIVTYTGTGANATVGHGLTKVPKLVIAKQRTAGTVENWAVSHTSIANTEYLLLNTTAAKTAGATYWNSTTPTTSVFSVGSAADTNESAKDFVAYCFADIEGYSKAFSYTGNASADGPYVHLGFKPRWILVKNATAAGNPWLIFDSVRDPDNLMEMKLAPNSSVAENDVSISTLSENNMDGLSSGFKLRTANGVTNQSAQTFIGFAIADVAGKYSLAR